VVLAFLVPSTTGAGGARADAASVTILEYGLFDGRVTHTVPLPKSVGGRMNMLAGVKLLEKTDQVVGMLGRSFGIRFRIWGVRPGEEIVVRTEHPPLSHPKTGRKMNYSEREVVVSRDGELRYTGYSFDHRYELAEGIWKFKILYRGKVLGEQAFNVRILLN
jgi:hypothetical protein